MDRMIRRFDAIKDDDLMLCTPRGVAYQRDMSKGRVAYDAGYLANYDAYARSPIAEKLNAGRQAMLARHGVKGFSVLDIGAASGIFVRQAIDAGYMARGFDVIPEAVKRLGALYSEDVSDVDVVTMWDSIEHIDKPERWLDSMKKGATLITAIPVFDELRRVRESKHYKPGEHLYYWTRDGFVQWAEMYGFRLVEESVHETEAGQKSIGAFAFVKDIPDYREHIGMYSQMHAERYYGSSATELHLDTAARVVLSLKPDSILDYGCGRSDLIAHFWRDGERRIERFDPAIPKWKRMPKGLFDLVLVCDVMEHIPMAAVDKVLHSVRESGSNAFFTISTKLARAKLPDGRNAHVTLLTNAEWTRWVEEYFKTVTVLPCNMEHELILLAEGRR